MTEDAPVYMLLFSGCYIQLFDNDGLLAETLSNELKNAAAHSKHEMKSISLKNVFQKQTESLWPNAEIKVRWWHIKCETTSRQNWLNESQINEE